MSNIVCKILEKRYDADPKVPGDKEGWLLVDILDVSDDPYYEENESFPNYAKGEIFGWTTREACDAELVRTSYQVAGPIVEANNPPLFGFVASNVVPIEWQMGEVNFTNSPEMQSRVFHCVKTAPVN